MAIPQSGPDPLPDMTSFLKPFAALVRRSESREAMERYATGLLADLKRKTAADMGRSVPGTSAQRLQEFLTNTAWDADEMNRIRIERMSRLACAGDGVLIIDDTGLPKKGKHSVGVARQYSGTLGRVDNCQRAHVPAITPFQNKGAIALDLVDEALSILPQAVNADSGYGDQPFFSQWTRDAEAALRSRRGLDH